MTAKVGAGHVTGVDATRAAEIIDETADAYGVTVADLCGRSRRPVAVAARDAAIRRLRDELRWSVERIGRLVRRDHTTVLHSLNKTGGTGGRVAEPVRPARPTVCAADGCGRGGLLSRGLCSSHYSRFRKYGDPLAHVPFGELQPRRQPGGSEQGWLECEVCDTPTVGGSRWCGFGRCLTQPVERRWSWSRKVAS